MRTRQKSVAAGLFFLLLFLTSLIQPAAFAVDPPYSKPPEGDEGPGGAFIDISGQRSFLHVDIPGGIQAHVSIGSNHNFAQPDTYVLEPGEPAENIPWPKTGAVNGKEWLGVTFSALQARYSGLDRNLFFIFDLTGGATIQKIETTEPFAAFFLPYSGFFDPYVAALIKGVPFEKLIRKDVAVLVPTEDAQGNLIFDLIPAINVGYDDLIVISSNYADATFYPVRLGPELLQDILKAYQKATMGTPIPLEVFHQAASYKLDFKDMPLGWLDANMLAPSQDNLPALIRILTADFKSDIDYLEAADQKNKKAQDATDLNKLQFDDLKQRLPELLSSAKESFENSLMHYVKVASGSPREAPGSAALAALWKDPKAAGMRSEMLASLVEALDYWKLELKSNDRIEYDMAIAAVIAGQDPAGFHFQDNPPYFMAKPPASLAPQIDRILSQENTEDDPLYATDYFGMSVVAAMVNRWDRSKELLRMTTEKCKEQIGQMNQTQPTLSQVYRVLVWGKMVGADKNPYRYEQLMEDYKKDLARFDHCQKRKREIILSSYNLSNFANQELHTKVRYIRNGILNCGKKPRPPKKPKKDDDKDTDGKPEGEGLKNARDGMQKFNNIRGLPSKIEGMFKVTAPSSNADVAKFILKGAKVPIPGGPFDIPEKMFNAMLDEILKTWDKALKALEQDPPRPDFQIFEEPSQEQILPEDLSEYSDEAKEFLKLSKQLSATLEAANVTFDRVGGARQAGNKQWEEMQQIHLDSLKYDSGVLIGQIADSIHDQASTVQSIDLEDPALDPKVKAHLQTFTQEDWDGIEAFVDSLRPLGEALVDNY